MGADNKNYGHFPCTSSKKTSPPIYKARKINEKKDDVIISSNEEKNIFPRIKSRSEKNSFPVQIEMTVRLINIAINNEAGKIQLLRVWTAANTYRINGITVRSNKSNYSEQITMAR